MSSPEGPSSSNLLDELRKWTESLSPAWLARMRTAATLAVLMIVVFVAIRVGLDRVAEPFPQSQEAPICTPTDLRAGDLVRPEDVTVSVLNAGGPDGSASRTLSDLRDSGFGRGQLDDAPDDTPRVGSSQIWTTEGDTAAVKLVRSYLKGKVKIVERQGVLPGINVVVGQKFPGVKNGRNRVRVVADEITCVPTAPVEVPTETPSED